MGEMAHLCQYTVSLPLLLQVNNFAENLVKIGYVLQCLDEQLQRIEIAGNMSLPSLGGCASTPLRDEVNWKRMKRIEIFIYMMTLLRSLLLIYFIFFKKYM